MLQKKCRKNITGMSRVWYLSPALSEGEGEVE